MAGASVYALWVPGAMPMPGEGPAFRSRLVALQRSYRRTQCRGRRGWLAHYFASARKPPAITLCGLCGLCGKEIFGLLALSGSTPRAGSRKTEKERTRNSGHKTIDAYTYLTARRTHPQFRKNAPHHGKACKTARQNTIWHRRGTADANIEFKGLCQLLIRLGFEERIRGSHHIYTHERIAEILNFQPKGRLAKPYQVKQLRNILLAYRLGETDVD